MYGGFDFTDAGVIGTYVNAIAVGLALGLVALAFSLLAYRR